MTNQTSHTLSAGEFDKSGLVIRALLPTECDQAVAFLNQSNKGYFTVSSQFCRHFCGTIFVCVDEKDEWKGLVVSYLSPNGRKVALLEAVVVNPNSLRLGIGSLLLRHLFTYWREQCVFKIATQNFNSELCRLFLEKNGYQLTKNATNPHYQLTILPIKICLNNRKMRPSLNTSNGEINEETIFEYFQVDNVVWGFYGGGEIKKGVLLGKMSPNGNIKFRYMQITQTDEIHEGHSKSSTEFLNDGRIALFEDWEWTGNRSGGGKSVIEEIRDEPF